MLETCSEGAGAEAVGFVVGGSEDAGESRQRQKS